MDYQKNQDSISLQFYINFSLKGITFSIYLLHQLRNTH